MAEGELVTLNGQYEWNGLLFNGPLNARPRRVMEKVLGLFEMPELRTNDEELQGDHGAMAGDDLLGARIVTADVAVQAETRAQMYADMQSLANAFQPQSYDTKLVYQKDGIGKKFVWARPRQRRFVSDYAMGRGLTHGSVMWYCEDPRIYDFAEQSRDIVIAAGALAANLSIDPGGFFRGGSPPILEIHGPALDPIITNAGYPGGRSLRLEVNIPAGAVLYVDMRTKQLWDGTGAFFLSAVRRDNQFWYMMPGGPNVITYQRANAVGSSTLKVRWNRAGI